MSMRRVDILEPRSEVSEVRRRILDVALELIAQRGFAATSTREIAERLGFSKAALYYHFRTKDDLLAALLAPAIASLARLLESRAEPEASQRYRLLAGYVNLVAHHEDLIRVLALDPSTYHNSAVLEARRLCDLLVDELCAPSSSGSGDLALRTRARAALGCVHSAVLLAAPGDDRDVVCRAALAAACGALGIACR
ncbi:MAG TPA: helix-turn-helix domain-containing protein [Thermomicrobiaceae bacterium]|nr:helix-turn-helix domain-containing protein [Thermomicrobiaceae bacterium]